MDFTLSTEEREVRDWVRTFVQKELVPREQEVLRRERDGKPGITSDELTELQLKAKESGFWGVQTPESHGGMGLSAVMTALLEAERKSCFAITEPGAGSDAKAIRTSARKDGTDWIINGEKTFITGGNEADFAMVFAITDPEKGANGGVTCFLVDRDMGWRSEYIDTMGEWGPAALIFEDVRVPETQILGELGHGFDLAMQWIGRGRYLLPARAIGSCERLIQMGIDHANTRSTFGQLIAERQAIQWMIADSGVELEALRWLVLHAAWQVDAGLDSRHAQSVAKLYGGVKANEIVDRILQIHGGMGYTRELPIERWYRELRLLRIYEGTDEIQRRTIARNLLKGHVKVGGSLG